MPDHDLSDALRDSLHSRLLRLLARPLIAEIDGQRPPTNDPYDPFFNAALAFGANSGSNLGRSPWKSDGDGLAEVSVRIDYRDRWNNLEKEVLETARNAVESPVALLTQEQLRLLKHEPAKFLALNPPPETSNLVEVVDENQGGRKRVVRLKFEAAPRSSGIVAIAIIPNLIPLQRQIEAIQKLVDAGPESPVAPLRALIGVDSPEALLAATKSVTVPALATVLAGEKLDENQRTCVEKALATPHFAVIHGPPGAGKTTVISGIIKRLSEEGKRVLVVSPTHVAVDNVVEKLTPKPGLQGDELAHDTIPVRYASRDKKLSDAAKKYVVGRKANRRTATMARRLNEALRVACPEVEAPSLDDATSTDPDPYPSLTQHLAEAPRVYCGTPIGLLSCNDVKDAPLGSFDALIVDEVSKMTIPEFLAVAVKAKRWVLVGDPMQLPPFMDSEDSGVVLDDVLDSELELLLTLSALIDKAKPEHRPRLRIAAVARRPEVLATALREHLAATEMKAAPPIGTYDGGVRRGIVICAPGQGDACRDALLVDAPRYDPSTAIAAFVANVQTVAEREIPPIRAQGIDGVAAVPARDRMPARLMQLCFDLFHALPWAASAGIAPLIKGQRNGIRSFLPSPKCLAVLGGLDEDAAAAVADDLRRGIAERYALQCLSVFDWLTPLDSSAFDFEPLSRLQGLLGVDLASATAPFTDVLRKQYRMHSSLSRVPRRLFYFDRALLDGKPVEHAGSKVHLPSVLPNGKDEPETNAAEADHIREALTTALQSRAAAGDDKPVSVMLLTPYRKQRELLLNVADRVREKFPDRRIEIEANTLDSCQGREADYVFVSLVAGRASPFLDNPKRWNVALTRARAGLFLVGQIDSYREEVRRARHEARSRSFSEVAQGGQPVRPRMSVIARAIELYDLERN